MNKIIKIKQLLFSLALLLSLMRVDARPSSFLHSMATYGSFAWLLQEAIVSKTKVHFTKKQLEEKVSLKNHSSLSAEAHMLATGEATYPNSLPQETTRNYILKRAQVLGIDTENLVITIQAGTLADEASATSFIINNSRHTEIEIGSDIQQELQDYLTKNTINSAPLVIEHELMHVKYYDSKNRNDLNFYTALGFSMIALKMGAFASVAPVAHYLINKAYKRSIEKRADLDAIKELNDPQLSKAFNHWLKKEIYTVVMDACKDAGHTDISDTHIQKISRDILSSQETFYTKLTSNYPSPNDREAYINKAIDIMRSEKSKEN